jgi:inorganic triphosphatase YgiF
MKQNSEIEAKFRVPSQAVFADLLALSQLGAFTLHAMAQPEHQHNIYFDTAARHLRQARHGFRIRMLNTHAIATLKGPATSIGSAQSRTELEVATPTADPQALPAGELADWLHELTQGEPLIAILTIDTNRQIMNADRNQQHVLEIALDDLQINAGGRSQHGRELEIECVEHGTISDLEDFAALIIPRYQLVAEPLSKLARGLVLLGES